MARAKKVKIISKDGKKRELPKDKADEVLAWCTRTGNVGLWKIDESDKKDND